VRATQVPVARVSQQSTVPNPLAACAARSALLKYGLEARRIERGPDPRAYAADASAQTMAATRTPDARRRAASGGSTATASPFAAVALALSGLAPANHLPARSLWGSSARASPGRAKTLLSLFDFTGAWARLRAMIQIGSLFAGIGGFELGLGWALAEAGIPHRVAWQVEIDERCRAVLARHWPDADRSVTDVRMATARSLEQVDIICGGFPCDDLSVAGRGAGLLGERSGLWFEFARILDECRPAVALLENVSQGRSRWLPFVRRDLCDLGYRSRAFGISAADVGAPHLRRRVFVVAHTDGLDVRDQSERVAARRAHGVRGQGQAVALDHGRAFRWQARPDIRRVDDGVPDWLDGPRLRALGGAVVPQVAREVGRVAVVPLLPTTRRSGR
jgi:DNA (cytosine-5)-methyltransferase 1